MAGYYDRDKTDAQPSMQWPKPHFGSVAEYQVSPWPFCENVAAAGSVDFKSVTRWIIVTAGAIAVNISFADPLSATETTYFTVPANAMSPRIEVKCTQVWVSQACTVLAGVTSVDTSQFPDISERVGVKH
jgi:hypothetical protein